MKNLALFGAGNECLRLLGIIDNEVVKVIFDNDENKDGTIINNITVKKYNLEEARECEILISCRGEYFCQIKSQLDRDGIVTISEKEAYLKYKLPNKNIQQYKDKHEGERCFVIGTGPSLTIEDLELLRCNKEVCFGANRIFKMFDDTRWRPDYYFVQDYKIICEYIEKLIEINDGNMFISDITQTRYSEQINVKKFNESFTNIFNLYYDPEIESPNGIITFSEDASKYISEGMTVVYGIMQLAYYMGFSEIYLLGVDFSYSDMSGKDENKNDHCCANYINKGEVINPPRPDINLRAYKVARKFAEEHNFHIYNATRGGYLEVFERVDLDKVLRSKNDFNNCSSI